MLEKRASKTFPGTPETLWRKYSGYAQPRITLLFIDLVFQQDVSVSKNINFSILFSQLHGEAGAAV